MTIQRESVSLCGGRSPPPSKPIYGQDDFAQETVFLPNTSTLNNSASIGTLSGAQWRYSLVMGG